MENCSRQFPIEVHISFPNFTLCGFHAAAIVRCYYMTSFVANAKWRVAITSQLRPHMRAYCRNVLNYDFTFTLPNETPIFLWPLTNNTPEAIAVVVCYYNVRSWERKSSLSAHIENYCMLCFLIFITSARFISFYVY
jgi:hypothetical protein